jgi:hypothetical protein
MILTSSPYEDPGSLKLSSATVDSFPCSCLRMYDHCPAPLDANRSERAMPAGPIQVTMSQTILRMFYRFRLTPRSPQGEETLGWDPSWQRGGGPRGLPRLPREAEVTSSRYGADCQPRAGLARMQHLAAQPARTRAAARRSWPAHLSTWAPT